ncbi:SRPBCC family protein [Micrococcales bacterium 31B]|nr:SRPBCC family protein [Micrococcales bacterium 31B]
MTPTPPDPVIVDAIAAPLAASLHRQGGRARLTLSRELPHAPEALWALLTRPERLSLWSPIVPDRPLDSVGPALSRENPGEAPTRADVTAVEPGVRLTHHWGDDVLTWTVTPGASGAWLELSQDCADPLTAPDLAAGWRVCLGRLAEEDGAERERPTGMRALAYGWSGLREEYVAGLGE